MELNECQSSEPRLTKTRDLTGRGKPVLSKHLPRTQSVEIRVHNETWLQHFQQANYRATYTRPNLEFDIAGLA